MSDCTTVLVAERDDELRTGLIGQLLSTGEGRTTRDGALVDLVGRLDAA